MVPPAGSGWRCFIKKWQIQSKKLMSLIDCKNEFNEWLKKHGYGNCELIIREWRRQRVNPERGEKKNYTWAQIKSAYKKQRGICPICLKEMALDRNKLHGDHWDCNLTEAEGLNSEKNCMATHKLCNLKKSTISPSELSKLRQLNPSMGEEET